MGMERTTYLDSNLASTTLRYTTSQKAHGGYKNKPNDYIALQKSREALGTDTIIVNGGALEGITDPDVPTFCTRSLQMEG